MLNDGTVVFKIVLFPQCLKIQWEEWQSIEPCILEILQVLILNAVHKFISDIFLLFKDESGKGDLQLCLQKCFLLAFAPRCFIKMPKEQKAQPWFCFYPIVIYVSVKDIVVKSVVTTVINVVLQSGRCTRRLGEKSASCFG